MDISLRLGISWARRYGALFRHVKLHNRRFCAGLDGTTRWHVRWCNCIGKQGTEGRVDYRRLGYRERLAIRYAGKLLVILILKNIFVSGIYSGYLSGTEQRYSQILRRDLCFREDHGYPGLIAVIALRGCCITHIKTCMLHVYFSSLTKACIYAPRTVSNMCAMVWKVSWCQRVFDTRRSHHRKNRPMHAPQLRGR